MDPSGIERENEILFTSLREIRSCRDRTLVDALLERLIVFVSHHFAHEESMMDILLESERIHHRQEHEIILAKIIDIKYANLRGESMRLDHVQLLESSMAAHSAIHDSLLIMRLSASMAFCSG